MVLVDIVRPTSELDMVSDSECVGVCAVWGGQRSKVNTAARV